jgi:uncharacterized protein
MAYELIQAAEAGDVARMRTVLDGLTYVDSKDGSGYTALWHAAYGGHVKAVKLLLERGADANANTNDGRTVLMGAAGNGHVGVVKLLLARGAQATINATSNGGSTAENLAPNDEIRLLLRVGDGGGRKWPQLLL